MRFLFFAGRSKHDRESRTLERAALEEEVHRQSAEIETLTRQIRDLTASHSDPP
jgi:cell division protein FtsB